jgi:hypothetical protein
VQDKWNKMKEKDTHEKKKRHKLVLHPLVEFLGMRFLIKCMVELL